MYILAAAQEGLASSGFPPSARPFLAAAQKEAGTCNATTLAAIVVCSTALRSVTSTLPIHFISAAQLPAVSRRDSRRCWSVYVGRFPSAFRRVGRAAENNYRIKFFDLPLSLTAVFSFERACQFHRCTPHQWATCMAQKSCLRCQTAV